MSKMTFRNVAIWSDAVRKNSKQGSHGLGIVGFAERWAVLMEGRIDAGIKLEDCAYETSRMADVEGVSGWMHETAIELLTEAWIHGEALLLWHNLRADPEHGAEATAAGRLISNTMIDTGPTR